MMTVIGVGIGAPLGLFAGTYLAEYGKHDKLTSVIRFINDILLSAPSIIIGLFIYGAVVVPMGGFSAFAGCLALAVIVIPVVVRTTEDMLGLVAQSAAARRRLRSACRARWSSSGSRYRAAARRPDHRRAAGDGAASPVKPRRCCSPRCPTSSSASISTKTMANLPVTINNFVQSPYVYWKQLAWSGALLITLTVLALNIGARILGAERTSK